MYVKVAFWLNYIWQTATKRMNNRGAHVWSKYFTIYISYLSPQWVELLGTYEGIEGVGEVGFN